MNNFSTKSAEQLFAKYPDWRKYAKFDNEADGKPFIRLEVPSPVAASSTGGLILSTANEEVTVEFDYYHSHFDDMVGDGENFGTEAALAFIDQILREEVAVVSWWNGDDWRGSSTIEAGEFPIASQAMNPFSRTRVRSWKGTLDADIEHA